MELKAETKRQANRVDDAARSRDKWRAETERLRERLEVVQAEKAALQEQLAGLKKQRPATRLETRETPPEMPGFLALSRAVEKVLAWCEQHLGMTVFAQRKIAFAERATEIG